MNRICTIFSAEHICPALDANKRTVLDRPVDQPVTARCSTANKLGQLSLVKDAGAKTCR